MCIRKSHAAIAAFRHQLAWGAKAPTGLETDQTSQSTPAMVWARHSHWVGCLHPAPPLVVTLGGTGGQAVLCSLRGNTGAQAAQGGTLRWPDAFRAVPLYRSQDSAYHRTYHEAAVSFIRTWAKTSTTTGKQSFRCGSATPRNLTGRSQPDPSITVVVPHRCGEDRPTSPH